MAQPPPQRVIDVQVELGKTKEYLSKGNSGIILIPPKATPDTIAAATSLYLGLLKLGKNVVLGSTEKPESDLFGADKIQRSLSTGGNNLVISFPYQEGDIDDVTYDADQHNFYVIITPREGRNKVAEKDVKFRYTGGKADFVVMIDAPSPQLLGAIFQQNAAFFQNKTIINIDRHQMNAAYGTANLVVRNVSSTSEIIFHVLRVLEVPLDQEIATNLYTGVASATNNFTNMALGAETFELIAKLMRAGAMRRQMAAAPMPAMPQMGAVPGMPNMPQGMNPYGAQMPVNPYQRPVQGMPVQQGYVPQYPAQYPPQVPQTPVAPVYAMPVGPAPRPVRPARPITQQEETPTTTPAQSEHTEQDTKNDSSDAQNQDTDSGDDKPKMVSQTEKKATPVEKVEHKPSQTQNSQEDTNPTDDNWLKPKLSKSGNGLV